MATSVTGLKASMDEADKLIKHTIDIDIMLVSRIDRVSSSLNGLLKAMQHAVPEIDHNKMTAFKEYFESKDAYAHPQFPLLYDLLRTEPTGADKEIV